MEGSLAIAHQPVDAVTERLNDPAVAASLVTILDHIELLSMMISGLNDFFERGDTIIESLAAGVSDVRDAQSARGAKFDIMGAVDHAKASLELFNDAVPTIKAGLPTVNKLLQSGIVNDQMIDILRMVGESAVEGTQNAEANGTTVKGLRGTMKALKEPEVARGMGLLVEIAKALGKKLG